MIRRNVVFVPTVATALEINFLQGHISGGISMGKLLLFKDVPINIVVLILTIIHAQVTTPVRGIEQEHCVGLV